MIREMEDSVVDSDRNCGHALGWASIGIGLAELAAPRQVEKLLGLENVPQYRGLLRILGIREVLHGVSLLSEGRATPEMASALWARVAGDVLDTALLAGAATKTKKPVSFAITAASVLAIGISDLLAAQRLSRHQKGG